MKKNHPEKGKTTPLKMLWQKNHQGLISSLLITALLSQTLRLPPSLLADRVQLHLVDAAELLSAAGVE